MGLTQRFNLLKSKNALSRPEPFSTALARYYTMNGLPADGGITDKWSRYKIGPFNFIAFPNFPHRVDAILRHGELGSF